MTDHHPRRRLGWLLAALGMLFVSTDAFFVRLSEVDAWTLGFLMACGSVISLGGVAVARRGDVPPGAPLVSPVMLVIGGLNAMTQMLFITAVTRSEVSNVVVIVAAAPLFAALIAWVALRERTEPRVAAAIALTTVGIGSVMAGSLGTPTLDGD
ncbi:MAG: EamA family transporter, partial [Ilumatobacteraceae bacterium]